MSDLNEMVRLFDEADDSAAFDGDHPILRLAIERDGLLERGKAQQSTIDSLRGEVERLEQMIADALSKGDHDCYCAKPSQCCQQMHKLRMRRDALAQSNDTPD